MKPNKKQQRTGTINRIYRMVCAQFTLNAGDTEFPSLDILHRLRGNTAYFVSGADYIIHDGKIEIAVDDFIKHGKIDTLLLIQALSKELAFYKLSEGKTPSQFMDETHFAEVNADGYTDHEIHAIKISKMVTYKITNK